MTFQQKQKKSEVTKKKKREKNKTQEKSEAHESSQTGKNSFSENRQNRNKIYQNDLWLKYTPTITPK